MISINSFLLYLCYYSLSFLISTLFFCILFTRTQFTSNSTECWFLSNKYLFFCLRKFYNSRMRRPTTCSTVARAILVIALKLGRRRGIVSSNSECFFHIQTVNDAILSALTICRWHLRLTTSAHALHSRSGNRKISREILYSFNECFAWAQYLLTTRSPFSDVNTFSIFHFFRIQKSRDHNFIHFNFRFAICLDWFR